jgi:hypothetical protein
MSVYRKLGGSISGYPKTLYAVKRVGADAAAEEKYTHWTRDKR